MLLLLLTALELTFGFECEFSGQAGPNGALSSDIWYWPDHRVLFWFDQSVIQEDRKIIRQVMKEIERNTCIEFDETPRRRRKYLTIHTETSYQCLLCSPLGLGCPTQNGGTVRSSPSMKLSFKLPFCGRLTKRFKTLIIHELFHVLGLIHTQNRVDRDRYITINQWAIDRKSKYHYLQKCDRCPTFNLPYECNSVMHYGTTDFARSGLLAFMNPTMTSRHPSCHLTSNGGDETTGVDWELVRRTQRCGIQSSLSKILQQA